MRNIILAFGILISFALSSEQLSVERIYSAPALSGERLMGLKLSPDGSRVTFLKGKIDDYERYDLWEYEIQSGKTQMLFNSDDLHSGSEQLSDEEKARRERLRLSGSGIVSYQWSNDGKAILFPLGGDIYYWKVGDAKATKITLTPEFETDIKFSPKGNYISFIRNQNIYIYDIAKKRERRLTSKGKGPIKYGMAEFVAQEEMKRMTGYWWSPDESKIAFTKVDESPVELVTRSEIYAEEIKTVSQRYPFAGENNVLIELAVMDINSEQVKWIDLGEDKDIYIPRVQWTDSSDLLSYQWQSRDQKVIKLTTFDWQTGEQKVLLTESSATWLNIHDDLRFLNNNQGFIWASEKDGFKHLYRYDMTGKQLNQITKGNWVVESIKGINQVTNTIYFSGRKDTPLESQLYSVQFDGAKLTRLTELGKFHNVTIAGDFKSYIDTFSDVNTPSKIALRAINGELLTWLSENKIDSDHPLHPYMKDWIKPELSSFKAKDGTELYYRLYKPANFKATNKYPVLVYLYGGPHAQMVVNRWGRMLPQYMAQQGYVVFTLDNRGSNYRGKAFEDPIYQAMGGIEVRDQLEGVNFLKQFNWVDDSRIGVHGHSYGGYMTLMSMFKAPNVFAAGVAGAPVTEWELYDTYYTERYMGNPKQVKEAYTAASVFPYAKNLKGALLIYHGMADDNVLFKNSTKLYKTLQDNNLPFFVMDYPGKKHGIRGKQTSMHRLNMIRNFFDLHFGIKR
ncbi:MAG: S9 family peptidase [Kangiellaceae bacterium]|jgi:dipeptidyl-peptidase-4|nr:S9 family peptidase [Kangiellaceae bacterium]